MYTSLGHSPLVAMTNDTCVKSCMEPQSYKVVNTHAHDISGWTILSIPLRSRAPHFWGMNGDVKSDLATLALKNGEELNFFYSRTIRLQQEIMLSGEIVFPTILIFKYMKTLSKNDKIRTFIAPNVIYLITFLDNNGKYDVYTGECIHGIYSYLEMMGSPTTLTTSGQRSNDFSPSSSSNNDAETFQTVIAAPCMRQKSIC